MSRLAVTGPVVVGIAIWIPLLFINAVPRLVISVMLLVICAAWAGSLVATSTSIGRLLPGQQFLVAAFGLFLTWLFLSVAWAQDASLGGTERTKWLMVAALVLVVGTSVIDARSVRLLVGAFVAGATLSVILGWAGAAPEPTAEEMKTLMGRFLGAEGNPSELAAVLLPAIVLAVALAVNSTHRAVRALLAVAIVILMFGLVATESRSGLVGVVVAVPAALVIFRDRWRSVLVIVAVLLVVGAVAEVAVSPRAGSRATSVSDRGAGRSAQWHVAWRIAKDHPIAGIGLDNFRSVAPRYVRRPGALRDIDRIVDQPHVIHNTYLGLLIETGIVGLGLFLAIVGACLAAMAQAARAFGRRGEADLALLTRAIALAALSMLVVLLFQADGPELRLWLLLALGPALATMARRGRTEAPRAR